ncbi:heme peroxidase family protein [Novosphingobium sp. 9U]|uniref:peroxidase family protein n=1 Tax=Novosphingobium sp. 9U TaxID=2653158 RepID=UPI0012F1C609|nr:heme peroxidase family protein [Novosphingobium sp. 9U]VWX50479.1 Peroxidase [Novosphingobium sp. 9U]
MARSHFQGGHRGLAAAADGKFGRFGRMFEHLEGPEFEPTALAALAETMIKADDGKFFNEADSDENIFLPAGYTYFGQFVDHDLTLDSTSIGEQESDPDAIDNFRTAALDLDCVYGNGPGGDLVIYDSNFKFRLSTHRIAATPAPTSGHVRTQFDHRRDSSEIAMIGDPRNDENVIVAQLHQAMTQLHNKVLDTPALMGEIPADHHHRSERFRRAARVTRWHYQWLIVNDYLKRICMPEIYHDIVNPGGTPRIRYYPKAAEVATYPYLPIEFSAAAYRFGHSMVRPSYALNAQTGVQQGPPPFTRKPIFHDGAGSKGDLRGFRIMPKGWGIDWGYFFELPGEAPAEQLGSGTLQPAYRIDTLLVDPLRLLVNPDLLARPAIERNLAYLNLLRGSRLRLPTAEQVALEMNVGSFPAARFPLLSPEQIWSAGSRNSAPFNEQSDDEGINIARDLRRPLAGQFAGNTPLWYYILREAEWYGTRDVGDAPGLPSHQRGVNDMLGGHHLGPIGSTIILETFLGLLLADPGSYIHQAGWRPMVPITDDPANFELKHLISWALT